MPKVLVDSNPLWVEKSVIINTTEINELIHFYVLNSPVDGLSCRQISLSDYGWNTPWRKPFCLRRQLNNLTNNNDFLYSVESYDAMEEGIMKAGLQCFPPPPAQNSEKACFVNNKGTQYMSLFYHIRNSFAHGRFSIVQNDMEKMLVMEDCSPKANKSTTQKPLSARIVLKLSTMLKWKALLTGGETPIMNCITKTGESI